jgi:homoserine kinase type II
MALLTLLDEAQARTVLSAYDLALESLEALPAKGTVNSNFRVRASGERWFLRVNEGKIDADVHAEAALIDHLRARGLPTPEVRRTRDGQWFAHAAHKPVTLFPWVDGEEAAPDAANPSTVRVVGRAVALLHRAGADLPGGAHPRNHYTLDALAARLQTFATDPRLAEIVPLLDEELARARARSPLPSGLIHQDLFPDNLLVGADGSLAAVLDLEQATHGAYIYDLAVSANAWCWDGNTIQLAAVDALLAAYEAERPLSAPERAAFTAEARLSAARFTITRITDVFLPANVDEDLRRRKDWREYARKLHFWRAAT